MDDSKIDLMLANQETRKQYYRAKACRIAYLKAYKDARKYLDKIGYEQACPVFLQDMLMQLEKWDSGEEE